MTNRPAKMPTGHPVLLPPMGVPLPPQVEIEFSSIQFNQKLSDCVFSGTLVTEENVAIKELAAEMDACIKECEKRMMLRHPNIVRVCGMSEGQAGPRVHHHGAGAWMGRSLMPSSRIRSATIGRRWCVGLWTSLMACSTSTPSVRQCYIWTSSRKTCWCSRTAPRSYVTSASRRARSLSSAPLSMRPLSSLTPSVSSEATDIYGFGGVLFAMITKLEPWEGLSMLKIFGKLTDGKRPLLPSPLPRRVSRQARSHCGGLPAN